MLEKCLDPLYLSVGALNMKLLHYGFQHLCYCNKVDSVIITDASKGQKK